MNCISRPTIRALLALGLGAASAPAAASNLDQQLQTAFARIVPQEVPSGILYDRVLPLSHITLHDGGPGAAPATLAEWRQMLDEMRRASLQPPAWPDPVELRTRAARAVRRGDVPIAILDCRYDRMRTAALTDGSLVVHGGQYVVGSGHPFATQRVFAAAALQDRTYRGAAVTFVVDPAFCFASPAAAPPDLGIDFDDGRGSRLVHPGERCVVHWTSEGTKQVRVTATLADGSRLHAGFPFRVERLLTPTPDDTLFVTADVPYAGVAGTAQAYVYLGAGHTALTKPVIVVEGFDLDNSMNWDELYALLDQQNLIEDLRADGYDSVVLNFTDATDYIQRNAFVIATLVRQVEAAIDPRTGLVLAGASMGGLASRYALASLESQGIAHRVRTFISFDAPQRGANIPLGIQYWVQFFAGQSADAAVLLSELDTPAARQMLVYHQTSPAGTTGQSDPLRAGLQADLAAAGDYPVRLRKVAIANGSGSRADQGFAAGAQIISYVYNTFLLQITGNVWAVSSGASQRIFDGLIKPFLLPATRQTVTVTGTSPYDNAPGGSRASMAEMDSTAAPYGDIVALYPSHCFIPTVSALDLDTSDLFYDVAGDANLLAHTPFDAVYFPAANQPHVTITAENAAWLRAEIESPVDVAGGAAAAPGAPSLQQNSPNPFNPTTTIRFVLPAAEHAQLLVLDVRGSRVATLLDGRVPAGPQRVVWDGRDAAGHRVGAGVYLYRLQTSAGRLTRKMVLLP